MTPTDYHLHVDLFVRERDHEKFEAVAKEFLSTGGFHRLDPMGDNRQLILALRTPSSFLLHTPKGTNGEDFTSIDYRSRLDKANPAKRSMDVEEEPVFRYVHLWRSPDLSNLDLARIMRLSADDKLYVKLDSLVLREVQDFIVRVATAPAPRPVGGTFIRVLRQFPSATLGEYLFKIGALLPAAAAGCWFNLGIYQNVTGPLNTVAEFWQTSVGNADTDALYAAYKAILDSSAFFDSVNTLHVKDKRETLERYITEEDMQSYFNIVDDLDEKRAAAHASEAIVAEKLVKDEVRAELMDQGRLISAALMTEPTARTVAR